MAYINPNIKASTVLSDLDLGPGWWVGEYKFGASPAVTSSDVMDVFYDGTVRGGFVADWFVAMEQVDTGSSASVLTSKAGDITISVGSPAVVTWNGHGLSNNAAIMFTYFSHTLPTGISLFTTYYVSGATTNTFNLSATSGGGTINTSGSTLGIVRATSSSFVSVTTYGVTFNIGVAGSDTSISGTSGLRWASNVDTLGRASGVSIHRATTGAHFLQNGHSNRIGLQMVNAPVTPAWANKRIWFGLLILPEGSMGFP